MFDEGFPWKALAIGCVAVFVTATITGLVVSNSYQEPTLEALLLSGATSVSASAVKAEMPEVRDRVARRQSGWWDPLLWIAFGLVIGAWFGIILWGERGLEALFYVAPGVFGSVVGGYSGRALGFYREGELQSFLGAVVGAIIVVIVIPWAISDRPNRQR